VAKVLILLLILLELQLLEYNGIVEGFEFRIHSLNVHEKAVLGLIKDLEFLNISFLELDDTFKRAWTH
jgi:hypothetical protein